MKIESLVSNVTAVGSPERADGTCYFEGDFGWALSRPIQAIFVVGGGGHCNVGTLS